VRILDKRYSGHAIIAARQTTSASLCFVVWTVVETKKDAMQQAIIGWPRMLAI